MSSAPQFPTLTDKLQLEAGDVFAPRFDADGLIPVIVTDAASGEVSMFAWMNTTSLALTLETGVAHFWSRSRGKLWKKGEESGNLLRVVELRTDCDQDVLWLRVAIDGAGRACHTGERTCFYRRVVTDARGAARLQPMPDSDLAARTDDAERG
jgi:phosphoribosyl-AMP cyclohydrolase